jgi:hypothetical protein
VVRELSFEGLVQTGLLYDELLPKLLHGVLHIVCKKRRLVRNLVKGLSQLSIFPQ